MTVAPMCRLAMTAATPALPEVGPQAGLRQTSSTVDNTGAADPAPSPRGETACTKSPSRPDQDGLSLAYTKTAAIKLDTRRTPGATNLEVDAAAIATTRKASTRVAKGRNALTGKKS